MSKPTSEAPSRSESSNGGGGSAPEGGSKGSRPSGVTELPTTMGQLLSYSSLVGSSGR